MVRDARRILLFGFGGFGVAAALGALGNFAHLNSSMILSAVLGLADLVLCAGSLLFVLAIDIEPGTKDYLVMWLVIAAINFVLYAGIGAAFLALLAKRRS